MELHVQPCSAAADAHLWLHTARWALVVQEQVSFDSQGTKLSAFIAFIAFIAVIVVIAFPLPAILTAEMEVDCAFN